MFNRQNSGLWGWFESNASKFSTFSTEFWWGCPGVREKWPNFAVGVFRPKFTNFPDNPTKIPYKIALLLLNYKNFKIILQDNYI